MRAAAHLGVPTAKSRATSVAGPGASLSTSTSRSKTASPDGGALRAHGRAQGAANVRDGRGGEGLVLRKPWQSGWVVDRRPATSGGANGRHRCVGGDAELPGKSLTEEGWDGSRCIASLVSDPGLDPDGYRASCGSDAARNTGVDV